MTVHRQQAEPEASAMSDAVDTAALVPTQTRLSPPIPAATLTETPFTPVALPVTTITAPAPRTWDSVADPGHLMPRVTVSTIPVTPSAPPQPGTVELDVANCAVPGYLIVEHPGPWDRNPLNALPERTAAALSAFAEASGVRVHLGRLANRPGRRSDIRVMLSVPDHEGLALARTFTSATDLADVDWADLLTSAQSSEIPDEWAEADPFLAIDGSTGLLHGERLAVSLAQLDPENVWVTSTLASVHGVPVLALPAGLLYASVSPADATDILEALWQFRVFVPRLLGRTSLPLPHQAAERALRLHLGADAEDAVSFVSSGRQLISSGQQDDDTVTITRFSSTWTVHPMLVRDPVLARMMPDLRRQPARTWRVVVDQLETSPDSGRPHLTVVEVALASDELRSVSDWDGINADTTQDRTLPDPTLVAVAGALPTGTALDLGCGAGRHSLWFAEHGWEVTAVDFSRAGLSRLADDAALRGLRIRGELADVRLWAPPTGAFDVVLAADLEIPDLVTNAARWVAPGGRLILIGSADSDFYDHVELAARATGARLRVLRANRSRTTAPGGDVREQVVVVALRPR